MKKLLLNFLTAALAAVALCASAVAQTTVTFKPSDFKAAASVKQKLTSGTVSISISQGTTTDEQFRIFKGQTATVSTSAGVITSVAFTCTASGTAKYGPGNFVADPTGYEVSDKVGTWTGSAKEVKFSASSNQVRATQIVVTVNAGGQGEDLKLANLEWTETSFYIEQNIDEFVAPEFSAATTAKVSFASDNEEVAKVDETGLISLAGGVGTATITASSPKNEKFYAGSATVKITVIAERKRAAYTLAKEIRDGGKYLIVVADGDQHKYAKCASDDKGYGYLNVEDAVVSGTFLKAVEGNEFEVRAIDGGYTISDAEGRTVYMKGEYDNFNFGEAEEGNVWTISVDSYGQATITNVSKGKWIQFSTGYNSFGSYDEEKGILPSLYEAAGQTALPSVKANGAADGILYNLMGQRVDKAYKGIVISNGHAIIKK